MKVDGKDVISGNVAYLHCRITEYAREFVKVKLWYRDDEKLLVESTEIGELFYFNIHTLLRKFNYLPLHYFKCLVKIFKVL